MEDNNFVRLIGTAKTSAEAKAGRLEFTMEVPNGKGTRMWFDCVCTKNSPAFDVIDGFVNEGERLEVMGHLVKGVTTERAKVGASRIEVKTTSVLVYVDDVIAEEE